MGCREAWRALQYSAESSTDFLLQGLRGGAESGPQSEALSKNPQGLGGEVSPDPAILNMAKGARARDPGPHTRAAAVLLRVRGLVGAPGGMRSPWSLCLPVCNMNVGNRSMTAQAVSAL